MARSKDLFDDSTMSFGEHLEALRSHLLKAIVGLAICTLAALYFGDSVVAFVRKPIDEALVKYGIEADMVPESGERDFWKSMKMLFRGAEGDDPQAPPRAALVPDDKSTIVVTIDADQLRGALSQVGVEPAPSPAPAAEAATSPPASPGAAASPAVPATVNGVPATSGTNAAGAAPADASSSSPPHKVQLTITSKVFEKIERVAERQNQAITLTVQEAFMMYLKVSIVAGLIISSPWVLYQAWLFVAAGLYPHERKYVYYYLPMSVGLFLGGAAFCFYVVFPVMLSFLLGFNYMLHVQPQIRLSEWISFAILFPVMFGLSFQLPLVMLFLERVSIFEVQDYRKKRRFAILAIAVISMVMTPSPDPGSMLLMMFPLLCLYELGIYLCGISPSKRPFGEPEAA
jgi:sec-independent protein translocase protein TatC